MSKINVPSLLCRFSDGHRFRMVTKDDIQPGMKMVMYFLPTRIPIFDPAANLGELPYGERYEIRIADPAYNREATHVLYNQIYPQSYEGCFARVENFLDADLEEDTAGPYWLTLYLLPANQPVPASVEV